MKDVILLKYGEIVLKGLNRGFFDNLLLCRVKKILSDCDGSFETHYSQSTLVIRGNADADMQAVGEKMKNVFGVAAVCRGAECEKDIESIKSTIRTNAARWLAGAKSFKCVAKRSDKDFLYKSPEICAICGGEILDIMPDIKVDVMNPDVCITIEIRDKSAFVHGGGEKAVGGMPIGSNGNAMLLLSGGIDSPVAGYMIAKRGVTIDAIYFESPPYTSEAAKEKVISLAKVLCSYIGKIHLNIIPITEIQKVLVENC
ncbi:MAG: THUMP domain-containing protein, partial [Clostridia bacterium]